VEGVRASGLRTVEELSGEALVAHPRAKLTVAGRGLLVERVLELGWPPARVAEAQGVSVATAYTWLGRWRAEAWPGWPTAAAGRIAAHGGCQPPVSRPSWPIEQRTESGRTALVGP
jgi:hypothetical protein